MPGEAVEGGAQPLLTSAGGDPAPAIAVTPTPACTSHGAALVGGVAAAVLALTVVLATAGLAVALAASLLALSAYCARDGDGVKIFKISVVTQFWCVTQ